MCDKFINDVESRWMQVARTARTVEKERIKSESYPMLRHVLAGFSL